MPLTRHKKRGDLSHKGRGKKLRGNGIIYAKDFEQSLGLIMKRIGILAGELSGDVLGAGLIHALKTCQPDLAVSGIGGPAMQLAGCHSLYDIERLSVMGFIEPLLHLPDLLTIRRQLYRHFIQHPPDVFIGIDSPDFNVGLELKLRQTKVPIVHYVSPSVWAWRRKRIVKIAKAVDLMLTLFPFEADFYQQHHVPVCFVGHPLADHIPLEPNALLAREVLGLDPEKQYIAILPGSRRTEIKYLAELFIETAYQVWKNHPNIEFISAAANHYCHQEFQTLWRKKIPEVPVHFFEQQAHRVLEASDVVLVTSGTATLEAMLYKRPMVIAYRMGAMTYQLARHLIKVPFIGLPNLLANEALVPEFIQYTATPDNLSFALLNYLNHPEKIERLQKKFAELHQALRCDANQKAARAVMDLIGNKCI